MDPKHKTPVTYEYSNPSLPSDIVFNILLLLPVKTLSRFKLVSKSWLSLISSPSFKTSHNRRSKRNPLLFITTLEGFEKHHENNYRNNIHIVDKRGEGKTLDQETADFSLRAPFSLRLVFSCLDLVCMYDFEHIYIRNPTTKEQITLPNKSSRFHSENHDRQCVTFAYLPSIGEYKVFRIFCRLGDGFGTCEVFTLGSKRWRGVDSPPFRVHYGNMVVVDEAIHILPLTFQKQHIDGPEYDNSTGMARFDLKKEEWSVLPMPGSRYFSQYSPGQTWGFRLRRLRGVLCMECLGGNKVDVWLLKDHSNCVWEKTYSIHFSHIWSHVVDVEEDGRILLQSSGDKLQIYDPKEERVEETVFSGKSNLQVSFYVQSFMTLDDESFKFLKKWCLGHKLMLLNKQNHMSKSCTLETAVNEPNVGN